MILLWGVDDRDLHEIEQALKTAGIDDYRVQTFPPAVAEEWEDRPVMITPLGSFTGAEPIRRALPFLVHDLAARAAASGV